MMTYIPTFCLAYIHRSLNVARMEDYAWGEQHTTSQTLVTRGNHKHPKPKQHDMKTECTHSDVVRSVFFSLADKGDKPVRNCLNFFSHPFSCICIFCICLNQDCLSFLAFAYLSPPAWGWVKRSLQGGMKRKHRSIWWPSQPYPFTW